MKDNYAQHDSTTYVADIEAHRFSFIKLKGDASKEPSKRWRDEEQGRDASVVSQWKADGARLGIDCHKSELVVVDVDLDKLSSQERQADTVIETIAKLKVLSDGHYATTQSGGFHFYFKALPRREIRNQKLHKRPKFALPQELAWLETRGSGGYVVAYQRHEPTGSVRALPYFLLKELLKKKELPKYKDSILLDASLQLLAAGEGERNDTLNDQAFQACAAGVEPSKVVAQLTPIAKKVGLAETEIDKTLESACLAGAEQAAKDEDATVSVRMEFRRRYPNLRFYALPGSKTEKDGVWLEWNHEQDQWIVWDQLMGVNKKIYDVIGYDMNDTKTTTLRDNARKTLREDLNAGYTDIVDAEPTAIMDANGTRLCLATGKAVRHRADQPMMRKLNVVYDPEAACPQWDAFLDFMTNGDKPLADYLNFLIGYSMLGHNPENIFVYLVGQGQNGKSTFTDTVNHLFGEWGRKINAGAYLQKSRNHQSDEPTELANLEGTRFALLGETGRGSVFNGDRLKEVTGDEMIEVRQKYGHAHTIKMQATLWGSGQALPEMSGGKQPWRRRLRALFINRKVPDDQRDTALLGKLKAEGAGILNRCLEQVAKYHQRGYDKIPAAVKRHSDIYIDNSQIGVADFIEDCCERDPDASITLTQFIQGLREYVEEMQEDHLVKYYTRARVVQELLSNGVVCESQHNTARKQKTQTVIGYRLTEGVKSNTDLEQFISEGEQATVASPSNDGQFSMQSG